jgi:hypothetical protein
LKYPDFEIRRLICKVRLSDYYLAIETGRYKKIPRHLRTCNKCETLDDETRFFLNCNRNEHLRKAFLSDFDNTNNTNLLEIILNPTNIKQVKSLGSFIKQLLNLFICCTLYVYVLSNIQCSHWPWLGWKLCLNKVIGYYYMYTLDKSQWSTKNRVLRNFPGNRWRTFHNWHKCKVTKGILEI